MERGRKLQVLIGLAGIGVLIAKWGLDTAFSETPGVTDIGRFNFVTSIYVVVVLYSLWKMFIPSKWRIPEFKEDGFAQKLPDMPVDESDPDSFVHYSHTLQGLDKYNDKIDEYKKKES